MQGQLDALYNASVPEPEADDDLSRQTLANWIINSSKRYFAPLVKRRQQELLKLFVAQSDETPTQNVPIVVNASVLITAAAAGLSVGAIAGIVL